MEDKSTPLLDAANKKLENPSFDCSSMSDADAMISKEKPEDAGPTYWYPLHDGSNSCVNDGDEVCLLAHIGLPNIEFCA